MPQKRLNRNLFGFNMLQLGDDAVVEDRDFTTPIMREMDDNCLS